MGFGDSFANAYNAVRGAADRRAQMAQAAEDRKFQRGMQALGMVNEIATRQAKYGSDLLTIGDQVNAGLPGLTKAQSDYQIASDRLAAMATLGASQPFMQKQEAVVASAKATVDSLGAHLSFLANSQRFMVEQTNQLDQQRASLLPLLAASGINMPQQGAEGDGAAPSAGGKKPAGGSSLGGLPGMSQGKPKGATGGEAFDQPTMVAGNGDVMRGGNDGSEAPVEEQPAAEVAEGGAAPQMGGPPMNPLMDYANDFISSGFDDVVTDGRKITVTVESEDEAKRATDLLELMGEDPVLTGRVKIFDRSKYLLEGKTEGEKSEKARASAIGRAARYRSAMLPTATQSTILSMAEQAADAGQHDQAEQLSSMASADVDARKAAWQPYLDYANKQVEEMNKDSDAAWQAQHEFWKSRGAGGLVDKTATIAPPAVPAVEDSSDGAPPAGMKDDAALKWWLEKVVKKTSFDVMNDPKLAVAYSEWLTAYKAKK